MTVLLRRGGARPAAGVCITALTLLVVAGLSSAASANDGQATEFTEYPLPTARAGPRARSLLPRTVPCGLPSSAPAQSAASPPLARSRNTRSRPPAAHLTE